jgi:thiaminase/transcriptional activator TenA
VTVSRPDGSWSAQLWRSIEPIQQSILSHPFILGLGDGTLPPDAFARYLAQDVHYLRDYARALAIVGAKAPSHADTAMFARHAAGAVEAELSLHLTLLPELGLDPAAVAGTPIGPTTRAYTSYLLATVYGGSFAEGLAAVLPCYWIYAEVGAALVRAGSPDPRYQRWIDVYAGEEFELIVDEVLTLVDRLGPGLAPAEKRRSGRHLVMTARYEWMFWDAATQDERWPL